MKSQIHRSMIRPIHPAFCILALISAFSACTDHQTYAHEDKMGDFFQKKEVTIIVTDSGLGGLSILAEAEEKMRSAHIFSRVNFIFFNSLFSNEGGYNSLNSVEKKAQVFDSALRSMTVNYRPDLILIGCNTLSAIYDKTSFADEKQVPVVGIIDAGVELIADSLKNNPDAKVILFATQTTVEENVHKKSLIDMGFLAERIVTQACPELVSYIERDRFSDETEMLIYAYADEAIRKLGDPFASLYVSFNCTHYGYSLDLWKKAFQSLEVTPQAFLNPNSRVTDVLFPPQYEKRFSKTEIQTQVVSMVEIGEDQIASISGWLREISPQTSDAFRAYEWKEDLFEWKKFLTSER